MDRPVAVCPRLGRTMLWDTAAGAAVATEAGCEVVGLDGEALRYDRAHGLAHHGFLVCAPGGGLTVCLRALASFRSPSGRVRAIT